jgi:hypothetical protein
MQAWRMSITAMFFMSFGAGSACAFGDIYVKMNGGSNSTGNGSLTTPYKTITKGLQVAQSGDVVRVMSDTTGASDYSAANGEVFPLRPATGVSIMGNELSRASWPRLGGDLAGIQDALISIEASQANGDRSVGTISKLVFRGEDVAGEDSPIALKIVAEDGREAGVTFVDNVCLRPCMNLSGSSGLATISAVVTNGSMLGSFINENKIVCSDRGGIELVSAAGTDEGAGYGLDMNENYILTEGSDTALFGISWLSQDLNSTNPEFSASLSIAHNVIKPANGGIVDGLRIVCEEHALWGSNAIEDNVIDGCSGSGVVIVSDGWEDPSDAEVVVFFERNRVINNGGSGIRLVWDPSNHETDLGYGYLHFLAEDCLIAGNGAYGMEFIGIGANTDIGEVELVGTTIVQNALGAEHFDDLELGAINPEAEFAEFEFTHRNCIVYGNGTGIQVSGLSPALLDILLATVWYSDWQDHPLAALATDPCVPEAGSQYVIDCDPAFASETGIDFHLTSPSPCIDVGDNSGSNSLLDIDRDARIQDGDCAGAAVIDMGADEFPEDC